MKPHIRIRIVPHIEGPKVPHWSNIIRDKRATSSTFLPEVDRIFTSYNIPFWVAAEYNPRGDTWSSDEKKIGFDREYRIVFQHQRVIPEKLIEKLNSLREVETATGNDIAVSHVPPPLSQALSQQTSLEARNQIGLNDAHSFFTKGNNSIKVAILDTGIEQDHPELEESLAQGFDFVDILEGASDFLGDYLGIDSDPTDELVGHGTHVAGIIGAKGLRMPKGVAPRCKIIPVRVLGSMREGNGYVGAGLIDNINNGIKWAVDQGADIINMSLGVRHKGGGLPHKTAIDYAKIKGVTIVGASGNDGSQNLYYPGALPYVISVGASNPNGYKTHYSAYGKVSFTAPGTQIYSCHIGNDYAFATGTSQAAPFVSGAAALLKSYAREKGKDLNDSQIKWILRHSSDIPSRQMKDKMHGYGRINLPDALKLLEHKLIQQ